MSLLSPVHAGVLAILAVRLWLGPYVVDDAYITFRYSENIARGAGFTYSPPDRVQGTTAPALAMLLAPAAAAKLDLGWTSLVLAAAADLTTAVCGAALLRAAGWGSAASLFPIFIAFWPGLVTYSVSGLETSIYVALHAAGFLAVSRRLPLVAGILGGLSVLFRPDGLLLLCILMLAALPQGKAAVSRLTCAATVVIVPWAVFSLSYFGTLVPASITAKTHIRLTAVESFAMFRLWFWQGMYTALSPIAVVGVALLLRRTPWAALAWWPVWGIVYAAAFITTGAFGPYRWYFVPLLPVYAAALAIAFDALVDWSLPAAAPVRNHIRWLAPLALTAAGVIRLPHLQAELEAAHRGREGLYRYVATELLQRQGCTLSATEIGTLGYYYRGPVLDLVGLVSPQAAGRPMRSTLLAERPCWIVSYDDHLDITARDPRALADSYALMWSHRLSAQRELLVFKRRSE